MRGILRLGFGFAGLASNPHGDEKNLTGKHSISSTTRTAAILCLAIVFGQFLICADSAEAGRRGGLFKRGKSVAGSGNCSGGSCGVNGSNNSKTADHTRLPNASTDAPPALSEHEIQAMELDGTAAQYEQELQQQQSRQRQSRSGNRTRKRSTSMSPPRVFIPLDATSQNDKSIDRQSDADYPRDRPASVKNTIVKNAVVKKSIGRSDGELFPIETELLLLTNSARARHGLRPLTIDFKMLECCRSHTATMARRHSMYHSNYPYAENVAMGQRSAPAVIHAWLNSSGHRRNLLRGGATRLAVAGYRVGDSGAIYWCQMFK